MSIVEKVRENINKELPLWDQPSIAVGIVKDGKIVLNEGFGYADVEKQMQSNADTMYQIGSCSKAFTKTARQKNFPCPLASMPISWINAPWKCSMSRCWPQP